MKNIILKKALVLYIILLFILTFIPQNIGIHNTNDNNTPIEFSNKKESFRENEYKKEDTLIVTLKSSSYKIIENTHKENEIIMNEFGSLLNPGYPKIPSKTFMIGLPPKSTINSINLVNESHEEILTKCNISSVPYFHNGTSIRKHHHKLRTYSSLNPYPGYIYKYLGTNHLRKFRFARIQFCPMSYIPSEKKIILYKEITLEIKYQIDTNISNNILDDSKMEDQADRLIYNYDSISNHYQSNSPALSSSSKESNYVILTTSSLERSVIFLKNWRELTGFSTKIVNITWIESNYDGNDLSDKIRNFLKDKYIDWEIEYVLIVGSDNTIPMKDCYPDKNNHFFSGKIPTDYYYADLTGNWDNDNDGFYGERDDDSPDFTAEVWVGRIPIDNPITVDNICQKIIEFEKTDLDWKKNALMIGAMLFLDKQDNDPSYKKTDGATVMQEIWFDIYSKNNFNRTTLYEKDGLCKSIFSCDYPLTRLNVTNQWSNGFGLVNWNAHGSATSTARVVWNSDDGDNIPENYEISSPYFISSYETPSFNNEKPSIVFSCSCSNAYPERTNNLGKSLLINGAVAFIGATRSAYGTIGWDDVTDGGCSSIDYLFSKYLIDEKNPCGKSLYQAKIDYLNNYGHWGWETYQNMYVFNLYGDPATSFQSITGLSPPKIPNLSGETIGPIFSNLTFSTDTTDPDNHRLYYKWNWGDGSISEWIGPYNSGEKINFHHQWDKPGFYEIKVQVRDSTGSISDWSDPFSLQITSPELKVESIKGGLGSVKVVIKNIGNAKATNILWSINIDEGVILKTHSEGIIYSLASGDSKIIINRFIIGFGLPVITVEFESEKTKKISESTAGLIIGPILII